MSSDYFLTSEDAENAKQIEQSVYHKSNDVVFKRIKERVEDTRKKEGGASERARSEKQSVVFFVNDGWTESKARQWLADNKLKPIKHVDKSLDGQLRYRLTNPDKYKRFITKKLDDGINIIIGAY